MEDTATADRFDPSHPRFQHPCTGLKSDAAWRCGELHACTAHARDRDTQTQQPVGRWRPCRRETLPGSDPEVCATHGGSAQQVIDAARDALARHAAAAAYVQIDLLDDTDPKTRAAAAGDILNRTVGKTEAVPHDLVALIKANPSELRRLLEEAAADPELAAALDEPLP